MKEISGLKNTYRSCRITALLIHRNECHSLQDESNVSKAWDILLPVVIDFDHIRSLIFILQQCLMITGVNAFNGNVGSVTVRFIIIKPYNLSQITQLGTYHS